ncbi:MAG: aldehyde dehydrogenase family protein [archaeon]|nr:aldehyde dehydrogenase family protein [archaeon]
MDSETMIADVANLMNLAPKYGLYIDGKWVPASDGKTFTTYCPATGEKLAECAAATKEDVDAAVKAAQKAFPAWAQTPVEERAKILNKIADAIEANAPRLAMIEAMDKGAPIRETTFIDIPQAYGQFRHFAQLIAGEEDVLVTSVPGTYALQIREPLGVIGQIVPWNFSLMIGSWKIAPALAAGNTIVFKPSSATSLSTLIFAEIIADILPPGVFNVVTGSGSKTGQFILDHPGINKLSFTGSTEIGYTVAKAAAEKIIPATLELGGKSPGIYFDDCNREKALEGVQLGILFNQGQVCAACSRVFIQDTMYDEFVPQIVEKFKRINMGLPWDMNTQMASVIDETQCNKILGYIEGAKKEGAKILCGGKRRMDGEFAKGFYIEPTIIEGTNDMTCAREEIFGPVVVIMKFHTEEEVIAMANDNEYGLCGGVWTQNINRALRVAKAVQSGRIWVNCSTSCANGIAFGGYKKSGLGREISRSALDYYTQVKAIEISMYEGLTPFYTQ